jgi:hypothetical protein
LLVAPGAGVIETWPRLKHRGQARKVQSGQHKKLTNKQAFIVGMRGMDTDAC